MTETFIDLFGKKWELDFIRKPTEKEKLIPARGSKKIPYREGWEICYQPYRTEGSGQGFYYRREFLPNKTEGGKMIIKYQRLALKNQETIEMKRATYCKIIEEFGTFYAYLKTMVHEPFIITME